MKNEHDNAFPHHSFADGQLSVDANRAGLTKIQYAMIHCTEPTPGWFEPNIVAPPPQPKYLDHMFGKHSSHPHKDLYVQNYNDESEEWINKESIPSQLIDEVDAHNKKWNEYFEAKKQYEEKYRIEKLTQWRVYFSTHLLMHKSDK